MHVHSNWCPISSSGVELGSYSVVHSSWKRINRVGFSDSCYGNGNLYLISFNFSVLRSGFCCETSRFECIREFRHGCSKLRVAPLMKPKRNSLGAWFLFAWAVEQPTIDDEIARVESNSRDDLPESSLDWDVYDPGNVNSENSHGRGNFKDEEGMEGEGDVRVDVRALARRLQLARTADDVEELLKDVGVLPLQVFSSIIRGFGRNRRLECAVALVEWLKKKKIETNGRIAPNLFIYNSLLGAVKQSGEFSKMEDVLTDMAQEGIVSNVVTYNTIMSIYLEQGLAIKALGILEEMPRKGLTPCPVSYSTALQAYRRMNDGNGALKFMIELRERYRNGELVKDDNVDWADKFLKLEKFTRRVCYQVMRIWLVKDDPANTKVLQLLMEMDKAGLSLDRVEEERLIWACTCAEHHNVAKELYYRIREKQCSISLSVCNHVIWLTGKAKKWWAALEIYEDLLEKGPKPNNLSNELIVSHFNVLLTAAKKRGIWRWGVRLLDKMEEKGLKPGIREWNAVLVACSRAAETSAAIDIFRRMVEKGEKPTVLSYGALLSALEKGKLYDEARSVWDHMIKVGVEPNIYAYTTMTSIFTGQGKFNMVEVTLNDMVTSGIEPTVVTYNAIITGCVRNGMSTVAYEWFHRMKARNISPDEVSYELLVEALAKEGKPRLAYELYLSAKDEGLNLSSKIYDAVIQSSQVHGASIDIRLLGPRPLEKNKSS
ncbi:pentatricopeptide repeat-containing protein At3g46610-like isoform X1 [Cucurbita moschata]|uniref:Pentatricopeptide repeat-containing protein At3g46610-like isoform X1 n=2 Tax=Cucurbita moschata TaxID=3662 RepID=A0A6J1F973_CUCMO|nr:pentatricopeptide repeat-containing protein At3g46610-like isoform X1 [Cucurbita moschata]